MVSASGVSAREDRQGYSNKNGYKYYDLVRVDLAVLAQPGVGMASALIICLLGRL